MNNEKGILDIHLTDAIDASGLMDMTDDMSKIAYYEEPEMYIYDLNTKEKSMLQINIYFINIFLTLSSHLMGDTCCTQ